MSGSIDKIEHICLSVFRNIGEAYGLALDRDAAFALYVHIVEHLVLEFSQIDEMSFLDKSICESTFPMVYMCDNTKVANMLRFDHMPNVYETAPCINGAGI
ncbi:MAG: hypothetical protein SAMD01599839_05390 [Rectinema sp.]